MSLPRVAICVAASLDGKITTATREPVTFPSRADRARLFRLRDGADALLVGAGTIRAEDPPLLPDAERREARVAAGRGPCPLRVIVSRSLDLPLGRALAVDPDSPVVVLTGEGAPAEREARLTDAGCRVLRFPKDALLSAGLAALRADFGAEEVLCEGGGALNAEVLAAGLAERIHLTLCPVILGGAGSPTLADGPGFTLGAAPRATLEACDRVGDELFLTYRLEAAVPPGAPG